MILVVRDTATWVGELERAVSREGYSVERFADVRSALTDVCEPDVDALIVASRSLPLSDVLALRECRRRCPSTPVVVVTTALPEPVLKRALESEATAFVSWPTAPAVLLLALRRKLAPGLG